MRLSIFAFLACLGALPAQGTCISPAVQVPLQDVLGFPVLRGVLGGAPASFLLDTGAEAGLLTPQAAAAFDLPRDPSHASLLHGTGGVGHVAANALVPPIVLGDLRISDLSLPVGILPAAPRVDPPVAGLIGADLLVHFDLAIDLAHGLLRLTPPGCATPPADAERVALHRLGPRLAADVAVNDHPMVALLDTGARSILLSNAAAARLGVDAAALSADAGGLTDGLDLHQTSYHWHRFASLRIGRRTETNPVLTVTEMRDEADLLLGSDWFARHAVWISWDRQAMWVR